MKGNVLTLLPHSTTFWNDQTSQSDFDNNRILGVKTRGYLLRGSNKHDSSFLPSFDQRCALLARLELPTQKTYFLCLR